MKCNRTAVLTVFPLLLAGSLHAGPIRIVAFGDSTTAPRATVKQVYAARLGPLLAKHEIDAEVHNAGVGGSHTGRLVDNARHNRQHALDRLQEAVLSRQPDLVIIQFGWNDSWVDEGGEEAPSRIPLTAYERNLRTIIETVTDDGARIILMTPNQPYTALEPWRFERTSRYARTVRDLAAEYRLPLVDVWRAYGELGATRKDEFLLDSVHPNDDGHALVANMLSVQVGDLVRSGKLTWTGGAKAILAKRQRVQLVERGVAKNVHLATSGWRQRKHYVEGTGQGNLLAANRSIGEGPFNIIARLRLQGQEASAASFFLGPNHFGFEGAKRTFYLSGPMFGGVKLLGSPTEVFERGEEITFQAMYLGNELRFLVNGAIIHTERYAGPGFDRFGFSPMRSTMQVSGFSVAANTAAVPEPQPGAYTIATLDLADQKHRQVVVDREPGQYLGHPTTVLLEDNKTILCVYPKGHGRGAIVYKRSRDGGMTWSDRLETPENWASSLEVPTIHRVVDESGKKRLIVWSGLYPARLAVSENDGASWSELKPAGDWGGIVVMGFVEPLETPGHYLAMFHDDGRFFAKEGRRKNRVEFRLYKTFSTDGGLTWAFPEVVQRDSAVHLCEPGLIRSPDGKQMAVLLRENSRRRNSHVIFSDDEGQTWTEPRELPAALTGDRHTGVYAPDGRLFISFRDTTRQSPTKGDWVAWVGSYEDIVRGKEGQYRVRLMDNHKGGDCAYPGVLILPDGTIVTTTYGHWTPREAPYVVSVRLQLAELDALHAKQSAN